MSNVNKTDLEKIYKKYNKRALVCPDPLQFLYEYKKMEDREVVGLVASSLAYGRVAQILKSVDVALSIMKSPREFLEKNSRQKISKAFAGFKHRFTTGEDMTALLYAAKCAIKKHGSIGCAVRSCLCEDDETILPAMQKFVEEMSKFAGRSLAGILPSPKDKSACKRLNLYFRWMVRSDEVDPGGWDFISPSLLVVPMDTHMHDIAKRFGFTKRKQADAQTSIEVTRAFKTFAPNDPVKYDFALTRFGIRADMDKDTLAGKCK